MFINCDQVKFIKNGKIFDILIDIYAGDIDVIAALGDRITAGTGANALTLFEIFIENRGLSFSIGGLLMHKNEQRK